LLFSLSLLPVSLASSESFVELRSLIDAPGTGPRQRINPVPWIMWYASAGGQTSFSFSEAELIAIEPDSVVQVDSGSLICRVVAVFLRGIATCVCNVFPVSIRAFVGGTIDAAGVRSTTDGSTASSGNPLS
jgi:hypothetical protein